MRLSATAARMRSFKAASSTLSASWMSMAGGAYVPAFFAGMCAPLRHARKQHVCPTRDPGRRGAYITTRGLVTYAPPASWPNHGRPGLRPFLVVRWILVGRAGSITGSENCFTAATRSRSAILNSFSARSLSLRSAGKRVSLAAASADSYRRFILRKWWCAWRTFSSKRCRSASIMKPVYTSGCFRGALL